MEHSDHPYEGYVGYIMAKASYVLYSTTRWQDPADVGNYFIVPTTTITDTNQKPEERKWQSGKSQLDTYQHMLTAL